MSSFEPHWLAGLAAHSDSGCSTAIAPVHQSRDSLLQHTTAAMRLVLLRSQPAAISSALLCSVGVASKAMETNMTRLGPLVLPWSGALQGWAVQERDTAVALQASYITAFASRC